MSLTLRAADWQNSFKKQTETCGSETKIKALKQTVDSRPIVLAYVNMHFSLKSNVSEWSAYVCVCLCGSVGVSGYP